jgi:regulator of sigma E protease
MMIFVALLFFIILIVIHEYGHFLAAKRNGVEVEEFGIGFPPKVAGKTFGKGIWRSYYTINLLPLGGFVRLKGEADADKGKGTYGAANFWVKTKIILAGVFMNFIVAWLIFTILAVSGIPSLIDNQYSRDSAETVKEFVAVGLVSEGSPASAAGIEVGDRITRLGNVDISSSSQLFDAAEAQAGSEVTIEYNRGGIDQSTTATLRAADSDEPFLGVGPADINVTKYPILEAPLVGAGTTLQLTGETYKGLGRLVSSLAGGEFSEAADNVSGPVGIFVILDNAAEFGFEFLVFFIGIISLTLAIMNSLPLPALDGGKLFVSGLFKVIKKPLTKETETAIHGTGFAVLLVLILLISYIDVQRFF